MPSYSHRVRLHFRSLSLTQTPFDKHLESAQRVYGQYGIQIEFGSGLSLGLSPAEAQRFQQIDGTCQWSVTSGEYAQLQRLGGPVPATDIVVYYVNRFASSTLLGCGGHIPGRPACIVAAAASRWDTPHEVGHVLLTSSFSPVHDPSTSNLMYQFSRTATTTPVLNTTQLAQMKRSPCCIPA